MRVTHRDSGSYALQVAASAILIGFFLWWGVSMTVFQWRHPKANQMACLRYVGTALTFGTIPQYQETQP